jgi:putative glycosyltransferase (TIGR04372 family)
MSNDNCNSKGKLALIEAIHARYYGHMRLSKSISSFIVLSFKFLNFLVSARFKYRSEFWRLLSIFNSLLDRKYVNQLSQDLKHLQMIQSLESKSNDFYWKSKHEEYLNVRKTIISENVAMFGENRVTLVAGAEVTKSLGHLAHFADRCKANILELDLRKYIIVGKQFANPWFVDNYLGLFFPILRISEFGQTLLETELHRSIDQICLGYSGGQIIQFAKAHNEIETTWQSKFHDKSLFSLSDNDEEYLSDYLRKKGLKEQDWYVTLHLRDAKYEGFRNSGNFENYIPAIERIIEEGGWVIRVGSQDTPPIPLLHPRFIDYANNGDRTDRLDICLLGKSRFHFGTSSGVSEIPPLFGKGVLRVNAGRIGSNWIKWNSIEVPRILVSRKNDLVIEKFSEQLNFGWLDVDHAPESRPELHLRDASKDEISAAVDEMLHSDWNKETKIQKCIEKDLKSHGIWPSTTVSKYFSGKHSEYFS